MRTTIQAGRLEELSLEFSEKFDMVKACHNSKSEARYLLNYKEKKYSNRLAMILDYTTIRRRIFMQENKWIVIAISTMLILSALAGILMGLKEELEPNQH